MGTSTIRSAACRVLWYGILRPSNRPEIVKGTKLLQTRILYEADIDQFINHYARNRVSSGADGSPIFSPTSRYKEVDKIGFAKHLQTEWTTPLDVTGWSRAIGCFDGELIIGGCGLSTSRQSPTQIHRASLAMAIEPQYRSKGVGKLLLGELIDWALAQRFLKWIDLGVFAHNAPARRLYESRGFVEVGRTVDAFRVDGHSLDDVLMTLDLDQLR